MGNFIDITGRRFGRLTVIEIAGYDHKNKKNLWRCLCDCGNETNKATAINLRSGISKSCGCLRSELSSERRKSYVKM